MKTLTLLAPARSFVAGPVPNSLSLTLDAEAATRDAADQEFLARRCARDRKVLVYAKRVFLDRYFGGHI